MNDVEEMSPAEHWGRIMDLLETLKVQVLDLEESLEDFNKSAL